MKTFDDFKKETEVAHQHLTNDLFALLKKDAAKIQAQGDASLLLPTVFEMSALYTNRLLKMYHEWLSEQLP